MKTHLGIIIILPALFLGACGGAEDTTGPSLDSAAEENIGAADNIGAAVGSLFGSEEQASLTPKRSIPYRLVQLLVREAMAQQGESHSACDAIGNQPGGISMSLSVEATTYGVAGSEGNFVTLTEANGCDNGGLYASWEVVSHSMTCRDAGGSSTTVTMTDSSGVFTETDTASDIYGTFNMSAGESSVSGVACHFVVTHEGAGAGARFSTAVCQDSEGNTLSQSADVTCSES